MNGSHPPASQEIASAVADCMAQLLQLDARELDPRQPFLEMGADSMMFVSAVGVFEERFGVRLSVRQLFEELNTLDALAAHLTRHAPVASVPAAPLAREVPPRAATSPPAPSAIDTLAEQVAALTEELARLRSSAPAGQEPAPAPQVRAASAPASAPSGAVTRPRAAVPPRDARQRAAGFSLYYFGDYQAEFDQDKYRLLFEGARFADENGFEAMWIPERHFHSFGGFSPNPSVVAAALARETRKIAIRASVVLPLHHPIRVAEEWSVVDNLSGGRVGLALASGWQANDFVFAPDAWASRREVMYEGMETVRHLWRGGAVMAQAGSNTEVRASLHPMPQQPELPMWLTTLGSEETFVKAGEMGVGVLTNLIGQEPEDLARKIALYRESLARHGFAPEVGRVTVLVHTFLSTTVERARDEAREPFCRYLDSSVGLFQQMTQKDRGQVDFSRLAPADRRYLVENAYERYSKSRALIGTSESCVPMVQALIDAGADEIACFVDFGVPGQSLLEGLRHLQALKQRFQGEPPPGYHRLEYPVLAPIVEPEPAAAPRESSRALAPPATPVRVPASGDQRMLWLIGKMGEDGAVAYNSSTSLRLEGRLEVALLRRSFEQIVERHEALRTTLSANGEEQLVHRALEVPFQELDLSAEPEAALARFFEEESRRPFDFAGPLLRCTVLSLASERHVLVLTVHHLVCDGVSVGIMLQELNALYSAGREGRTCVLAPPMQFREFLASRVELVDSGRMAEQERYWLEKVRDLPELELPTDRPRPSVKTHAGAREVLRVSPELYRALKAFSEQHRCTHFMTLMAVYSLMLHRLSGQSRLAVGIAFSGRTGKGTDSVVGYCSNPYPIRSCVDDNPLVEPYLASLKGELLEAYDRQDLPFADLIERARSHRDPSRSPFFTTCFNWDRYVMPKLSGLDVRFEPQPIHAAEYDLMPNVMEVNGELVMMWDYNRDLFDAATIRRMSGYFSRLLTALVVERQAARVLDMPMLPDAERRQVLEFGSGPVAPVADEPRIHALFEARAAQTPDAVALIANDVQWTYRQLNEGANRVAHALLKAGVAHESVGLCAQPSVEMLAALYGILKAGASYVPVDPGLPEQRQVALFKEAGVRFILADAGICSSLESPGRTVLPLDPTLSVFPEECTEDPAVPGSAGDLAYVIFTSGSTGRPKGVQIEHRGVVNLVEAMREELGFDSDEVLLNVAPFSFDLSVPDFFLPLTTGATLVLAQTEDRWRPERLAQLLELHQVTVMQATPSTWGLLVAHGWRGAPDTLKAVSGGEATPSKLAQALLARCKAVWNFYGPTEATVWATARRLTAADAASSELPMGKPLQNVRTYVLEESGELAPVGATGELYIGGAGVARGYLGQPELSSERFVVDPFCTDPGARLYRTGDLGRWRPDGQLEFGGRRDQQVKLRGFRIELGEIESRMRELPGVRDAVVAIQQAETGARQLVGFVILAEGAGEGLPRMREALRSQLPEYMVPVSIVGVSAFPRTPNGKVDRGALPRPEPVSRTRAAVAPATEVQKKLARVWEGLLQVEGVGIQDDFFSVGGSSLLLHRLQSAIEDELQVKVPIKDLFRYPTIKALEGALSRASTQQLR